MGHCSQFFFLNLFWCQLSSKIIAPSNLNSFFKYSFHYHRQHFHESFHESFLHVNPAENSVEHIFKNNIYNRGICHCNITPMYWSGHQSRSTEFPWCRIYGSWFHKWLQFLDSSNYIANCPCCGFLHHFSFIHTLFIFSQLFPLGIQSVNSRMFFVLLVTHSANLFGVCWPYLVTMTAFMVVIPTYFC